MSSGMSGRGLSWKCALLLIRTRGWICGQCTPWDNLVWNHVTTHQKEAPAHAQGTNRGSLHESMGKVSSGKLFPWGRSEGTERDRGTLPLPSDSSLILPRNWLRKKGLLVKALSVPQVLIPQAGWPAGSLRCPWLWGWAMLGNCQGSWHIFYPSEGWDLTTPIFKNCFPLSMWLPGRQVTPTNTATRKGQEGRNLTDQVPRSVT